MNRTLNLPLHEWRDPQPAADYEAGCQALWPDSAPLRERGARRTKRARACREAVTGVLSVALCAFLLLGPSLLTLAGYLAGLAALSVAAVVAVALKARRDNESF